jgi:sugar O-acyltransferase (sialic acid O-acetyltransferase NeuD family)
MSTPIIVFGLGQNAELAFYYTQFGPQQQRPFEVIAFTCDREYMPEAATFLQLPVIPFDHESILSFWSSLYAETPRLFVPISFNKANTVRADKFKTVKSWGMELVTFIHPMSSITVETKLGENCLIADLVAIQPGTMIGDNTIVRSLSAIGSNCKIGNHCWISAGATLADQVEVGDYSFIGAGSIIESGVSIGENNIIGLGSVITSNTHDGECYLAGVNHRAEKSFVPHL